MYFLITFLLFIGPSYLYLCCKDMCTIPMSLNITGFVNLMHKYPTYFRSSRMPNGGLCALIRTIQKRNYWLYFCLVSLHQIIGKAKVFLNTSNICAILLSIFLGPCNSKLTLEENSIYIRHCTRRLDA